MKASAIIVYSFWNYHSPSSLTSWPNKNLFLFFENIQLNLSYFSLFSLSLSLTHPLRKENVYKTHILKAFASSENSIHNKKNFSVSFIDKTLKRAGAFRWVARKLFFYNFKLIFFPYKKFAIGSWSGSKESACVCV